MRKLLEWVSATLGEATMGLLALGALALGVAPFAFELSPDEREALRVGEWAIVAVFALEYLVDLALAPSKRAYVLSGWRLLDLAIISGPFVGLWVKRSTLGTPALRLLRVARIVSVGARLGSRANGAAAEARSTEAPGLETISLLREGAPLRAATFEELRRGVAEEEPLWLHGAALERERLSAAGVAAGAGATLLGATLEESEYPRLEHVERGSALFAWIPAIDEKRGTVKRNGLVLHCAGRSVLSVSRQPTDLPEKIATALLHAPASEPFATRVLLRVLEELLHRYERVAGHFERKLRELELVPVRESRSEFLEDVFRTQRQLAFVKSDLWRLRGILAALAEKRLRFAGLGDPALDQVRLLADEASYVYETVFNTREGLLSLLDLHINVVSFDMNRVMRALAVLSALGLVPAVAGGLLGMNLVGNPWPFTLAQVSYAVLATMAGALYVFSIKGWLR